MRLLVAFFLLSLTLAAQKTVLFSDDFSGLELDLRKWVPHEPGVASQTTDLPALSGGEAHLREGQVLSTYGLFSFLYGRIEVRLRLPGKSTGRARLRIVPVPLAPLPSIEVFAWENTRLWFGNQWGTEQTERTFGDWFDAPGPGQHVIAVEWGPKGIQWSIDGKEKLRSTEGVASEPMFLLLEGPVDVDYVRVLGPK